MAQFLRPDINVTQTNFTNGFAAIDEAAASDADFAYGANNTAAVLEVGLTDPAETPGSGTVTVRYRVAKTNAGAVDGGGSAVTVTAALYQGTNLIDTDAARTATGTWTQYEWNPNVSTVDNWTLLRLRFTTSASGGSPANRRGGAVSWAELEAPDAAAAVTHTTTGALTGQIGSVAGSASSATARPSSGALTGQLGSIAGSAARTRQHAATGALVGPGSSIEGAAARAGVPVTHATSGALTGQIGSLSGSAARFRAMLAQGALAGQGAIVAGSASRSGPAPVSHAADGALAGQSSLVVAAAHGGGALTPVPPPPGCSVYAVSGPPAASLLPVAPPPSV